MKWLRYPLSLSSLLLLAGAACDGLGQECTEIGCADGVLFDVLPEDGLWEEGAYALVVRLDDVTYTCEFSVPADLPTAGLLNSIPCGGLNVELAQRTTCSEVREGTQSSQGCEPIPDQYDLLISSYGTPAESRITLERDGDPVLNDERTLDYEETFPNGEDCDPGCKQTRVVLEP